MLVALRETMKFAGVEEGNVIITSDNCSQHKSAKNFADLQLLSNEFNMTIVRISGVAGRSKNEVDSTAKIALRTAIACQKNFFNAASLTWRANFRTASIRHMRTKLFHHDMRWLRNAFEQLPVLCHRSAMKVRRIL